MQLIPIQTHKNKFIKLINKIFNDAGLIFDDCDYELLLKESKGNKKLQTLMEYRGSEFKKLSEYETLIKELNSLPRGVTQYKMLLKYGDSEGTIRWDSYREKQRLTNTLEYKKKKFGWSKNDFDEYNKGRAITRDLCIKRYGIEQGELKWKKYCEKQAYTNTEEYLGSERYKTVNKQKGQNLENYIRKYGIVDGPIKYEIWIQKLHSFYSEISQKLFSNLINRDIFKNKKCYYATHNKEYAVYSKDNNRCYKYDFVCVDLKICIEFNGDHYHGNPKIYKPNDFMKGRGQKNRMAKDAWLEDEIKNNAIKKERGYDVIVVWELDYKKNPNNTIEKIEKYILEKNNA